jgi:UrcA family protein
MGETPLPRSVQVRYADLNLNTPQDFDVLYRRIEQAAHKVCADRQAPGFRGVQQHRSCVQLATDHALDQVRQNSQKACIARQAIASADKPTAFCPSRFPPGP